MRGISTVFRKEVRENVRDRRAMINSLLVGPLLLLERGLRRPRSLALFCAPGAAWMTAKRMREIPKTSGIIWRMRRPM